MDRFGLALFALRHAAAYGLWRSGADMCGGSLRRHRADTHRNLAAQALHALLGRAAAEQAATGQPGTTERGRERGAG
jgi:hypothetical protein